MERSKTDEIVDAIINGHAFDKHLSEFDNPHLGQPLNINTKEELGEHLKNVLESNETLCFNGFVNTPKSEADFYYHDPSNTAIVVPSNNNDEPTSYRPKEYLDNFIVKLNQAIEKDGAITICNGIQELHPEYYQNVEKNVSVQEVQPSEQSQEPQAKKLMFFEDSKQSQEPAEIGKRQTKDDTPSHSEQSQEPSTKKLTFFEDTNQSQGIKQ